MCAHSYARSESKYLAYFPVQGVFRAPGTDVTLRFSVYSHTRVGNLSHYMRIVLH